VTSGSARNEYQYHINARDKRKIPPIKVNKEVMESVIVTKYYNEYDKFTNTELDEFYYLTNGIFLEIHEMFENSDDKSFDEIVQDYKENFHKRFKKDSHKRWRTKVADTDVDLDDDTKEQRKTNTIDCIISYFFNTPLKDASLFTGIHVDQTFFYIEKVKKVVQDAKQKKVRTYYLYCAKFLTPMCIDKVMPQYQDFVTFNQNIAKKLYDAMNLFVDATDFANSGKFIDLLLYCLLI
jgi:hypothetical protein